MTARAHRWVVAFTGLLMVSPAFTSMPASAQTPPTTLQVAPVAIAMGGRHSILLAPDGTMYGVGNPADGALTNYYSGGTTFLVRIAPLPGGVRPRAVSAGAHHTLVLGTDGVAYGVGLNNYGQLTGTDPSRSSFAPLTGLPAGVRATAVSAGLDDSLVLGSNGVVYGAGLNNSGELTGDIVGSHTVLSPLRGLPAGVKAIRIASGEYSSLVVGSDGRVYGTGANDHGQLTGTATNKTTLAPLTGLPSGVRATEVTAGQVFTLVIGSDGKVYGTGLNNSGQLGRPKLADTTTLAPAQGLPLGVSATAVAAGSDHSLALGSDGVAYGAGMHILGQLGATNTSGPFAPIPGLPSGIKTKTVAAATNSSTIIGDDGVAHGMGYNYDHELTGSGSRWTPTPFENQAASPGASPMIVGSVVTGRTVAATPGTWAPRPTDINYQWLLNGVPIPGATAATYLVKAADWTKLLSVTVTAQRSNAWPGSSTSATLRVYRPAPVLRRGVRLYVFGTPVVGRTLRAVGVHLASWTPAVTGLRYQWLRNGITIKGATKPAYIAARMDRGKRLRVRVTATRAYYLNAIVTSPATAVVH